MTLNEALFAGIKAGNVKEVASIIDRNPKLINSTAPDGWTTLQCAVYHNRAEVLKYLITRGVPLGPDALVLHGTFRSDEPVK